MTENQVNDPVPPRRSSQWLLVAEIILVTMVPVLLLRWLLG